MTKDNPLHHRDFVLWWIGSFVSFVGSQMTWVAVPYQLYILSDKDPLAMGALGIARAVPLVGMSLVGGVLGDVFDRRRLLLLTQSGFLLVSLVLAVTAWRGVASMPLLYALMALGGALVAVDLPTRQALLPSLVPREALPKALAMQAWTYQLSTLLGPAFAGVILAVKGPAWVYAIDAATFAGTLAALLLLSYRPSSDAPIVTPTWQSAMEGVRFVWNKPVIKVTMIIDFLATFFADAKFLMPIFARDLLGGTERTLGLLLAAPAVGASLMAFAMSWLPPPRRQGALILVGIGVYGLATITFGLSTSLVLSLAMMALMGAADTVSTVIRNTLRQELTPNEMKARMVSLNMIFFIGGPFLGEFEAGLVARLVSPRAAVVSGGCACVLIAGLALVVAPWLWNYERTDVPRDQ